MMARGLVLVAALAAPVAAEPAAGSAETTPTDVAAAPPPGAESGRLDREDGDSVLRRGLRGALFVPKLATELALSPVRGTIWAFDRYHLVDLYYRVFFNASRTVGLVPTASYDSGFGISAGARFVDRDLFGRREHLSLSAAAGGRYRQTVRAALRSGDRLGEHLELELEGEHELRPQDPFYGIGDHDDSMAPAAPVDPRTDPTAVETRYRERIDRVIAVIDGHPVRGLHLRSSTELAERAFSPSEVGRAIDTVYDPAALVGYDGLRYLYSELELRLDSRRRATPVEPRSVFATGSLAAVFAGLVHRLDDGRDYVRYGGDLQHFVRLAEGPRVVALRLHGEAVTGGRTEVAFTELPSLGGARYLRGYPTERFRDRIAMFGSLEYQWDLSALVSASVFADAGRVFPELGDLSLDRMRLGYGIALEGHSDHTFALQGSLASSIDGGLFFNLSFNPVYGLDDRVRRR